MRSLTESAPDIKRALELLKDDWQPINFDCVVGDVAISYNGMRFYIGRLIFKADKEPPMCVKHYECRDGEWSVWSKSMDSKDGFLANEIAEYIISKAPKAASAPEGVVTIF